MQLLLGSGSLCWRNHHHRTRCRCIHAIGIHDRFLRQLSDRPVFHGLLRSGVPQRLSLLSSCEPSSPISQDDCIRIVVRYAHSDRILVFRLLLLRHDRIPEIGLIVTPHPLAHSSLNVHRFVQFREFLTPNHQSIDHLLHHLGTAFIRLQLHSHILHKRVLRVTQRPREELGAIPGQSDGDPDPSPNRSRRSWRTWATTLSWLGDDEADDWES